MARPIEINIDDLVEKFNLFIAANDNPMIEAFCLEYDISKNTFYRWADKDERLSHSNKKAIMKQELFLQKTALEKPGTIGFINFKLKQPAFGWKDKQEIESRNENVNINKNLPNSLEELEKEIAKLESETE